MSNGPWTSSCPNTGAWFVPEDAKVTPLVVPDPLAPEGNDRGLAGRVRGLGGIASASSTTRRPSDREATTVARMAITPTTAGVSDCCAGPPWRRSSTTTAPSTFCICTTGRRCRPSCCATSPTRPIRGSPPPRHGHDPQPGLSGLAVARPNWRVSRLRTRSPSSWPGRGGAAAAARGDPARRAGQHRQPRLRGRGSDPGIRDGHGSGPGQARPRFGGILNGLDTVVWDPGQRRGAAGKTTRAATSRARRSAAGRCYRARLRPGRRSAGARDGRPARSAEGLRPCWPTPLPTCWPRGPDRHPWDWRRQARWRSCEPSPPGGRTRWRSSRSSTAPWPDASTPAWTCT